MQTLCFFLNVPAVLLLYVAAAMVLVPDFHGISVVLGLPYDFFSSGMDYMVFGRWLLVTAIPILVNGLLLERGSRIGVFIKIRGRQREDFCRKTAAACIENHAVWCCFLTLCLAFTKGIFTAAEAFLPLQTNALLWESILAVLYYRGKASASSGWITILILGIFCLVGLHVPSLSHLLPPFWGMLCRNSGTQYGTRIALNLAASAIVLACLREREE